MASPRWQLADFDPDSHHFIEGPMVRGPKEVGCAFAASFLVSPFVSIIDKAMVKPISGTDGFFKSMGQACGQMVFRPSSFFTELSFRMTLVVYFGTYAIANLSEMILDEYRVREIEKRKQVKVSAASFANISLLSWRDSVFARAYGGGIKSSTKTPIRTIGLFAIRDSCTMAATFYFAPKAAAHLQDEHGLNREASELSMALTVPVVSQVITAPLHIHAIDYYNRPNASIGERLKVINAGLGKISFARSLRILPAFGFGSYYNNKFRELTIRQPDLSVHWTRRVTRIAQRATRIVDSVTGRDAARKGT